ncbi:hypothetical protein ACFE04_018809 [Oxalis oulophora]
MEESTIMIDEIYEFSAPRFFDFTKGESAQDMSKAELWFDKALAYAPSPFQPRIKAGRSLKMMESLCNFNVAADQMQKDLESSNSIDNECPAKTNPANVEINPSDEIEKNQNRIQPAANVVADDKIACEQVNRTELECPHVNESVSTTTVKLEVTNDDKEKNISYIIQERTEACTPKLTSQKGDLVNVCKKQQTATKRMDIMEACTPKLTSQKGDLVSNTKKQSTAKKMNNVLGNPSALKSQNEIWRSSKSKIKPASVKRETNINNTITGTPHLAQENQAIKRQKLDGGRSRQILNPKPQTLLHKSKPGQRTSGTSNIQSLAERKIYVRDPALPTVPFVSTAEMVNKFQSSTRGLSIPGSQAKVKLTLTRPKEPDFETNQRVRSVKLKSTAELEEEMMAKIPKFKARPINKKIFEGSSLPPVPRSTPQLPEFKEFHLQTMARANQNAETSSIASTEVSRQNNNPWMPHQLTEPKTPLLQTSLRARPLKVKSTVELEQEELEKAPKFKARPLNKKIFESKGELGIFVNLKKSVTQPQEFHFATDERIPLQTSVADMFDKLSLNSESRHGHPLPRNTMPNPFNLHTEERGAEKEKKFVIEILQKQWEEERARIPKANPYPYTTDYPVIPPKPEPKQCTRPEPFELESLVRHEEERQREEEERRRKEKEEAQMRLFRAQPILKEDPIPLPEKMRMPLTEVQEFNLQVQNRAVERAQFDDKIKEKEMMYKRYREENEAAKLMEEEKALKQLRRTMVPHARPVPNFDNPFCPKKSYKTTKAKSPPLRVDRRKELRKMVRGVASATSAAAQNMR